MKILFTTDLHGYKWKYERIFEIAIASQANAVINSGDMLPLAEPPEQRKFISTYLGKYFARFNSEKIYYLCHLGNDDFRIVDDFFDTICNKYPFIVNLAQRLFKIEDFEFIGMNWIVDCPFRLKDRCRMDIDDHICPVQYGSGILSATKGWKEIEDWFSYAKTLPTIENELNQLPCPENMRRSVYVMHMPPFGIGLDKCWGGEEAGSKAIYNFLKKKQPKLSLHGHIHESPEVTGKWCAKIGNTLCIQPGQPPEDELAYVIIDLSTMKVDREIEHYETYLWLHDKI